MSLSFYVSSVFSCLVVQRRARSYHMRIQYLKVRGLPFQATWMLYFWQGRGATVQFPYMFPLVHWKREIPMEHGRMRHPLPLPSDVAYNTSDFAAQKNYASSCDEWNTYRVVVVFSAIYNGTEYTVDRTSRSVTYK